MTTAGASLSPDIEITAEASLISSTADDLRMDARVCEGDLVAQGQPLMHHRNASGVAVTAPMAGRVATLDIDSAKRLRNVTLFHEPAAGRHSFDVPSSPDRSALCELIRASGLWGAFRSRPFGHLPKSDSRPAAIFVMALDTHPGAPDPRIALSGQEEAFAMGLRALTKIAKERVFLCQSKGPSLTDSVTSDKLIVLRAAAIHPWGLAGFHIHHNFPALPEAPVWDIRADDVAAIGQLLATGQLPETRLVSVTGSGMRIPRLVRCQPWADMRALCQGHVQPGPNTIQSGSVIDGSTGRWLRERDRQVTVTAARENARQGHWFLSALNRESRALPLIPTAAIEQSMGGELPAMPLLRALSSGDSETAIRLGALSLLPEDLALADYVTGAEPSLSALFAGLLQRIETEDAV